MRRNLLVGLSLVSSIVAVFALWRLLCVKSNRVPGGFQDAWLSDWSDSKGDNFRNAVVLPKEQINVLDKGQWAEASRHLSNSGCVELSSEMLTDFAISAPPMRIHKLRAFLVRCVTTGFPLQQTSVALNGDTLFVNSGMLTHRTVRQLDCYITHTPIVIWLPKKPKTVIVTFLVAE